MSGAPGGLFVWGVQDQNTGLYIGPLAKGHQRGGSWQEPDSPLPRVWASRRAAVSFVSQWLRGRHYVKRGLTGGAPWDGGGEEETWVEQEPLPHRKAENMRVVCFKLVEVA